jgi:glycolate oxidase iron-sulfur subunit
MHVGRRDGPARRRRAAAGVGRRAALAAHARVERPRAERLVRATLRTGLTSPMFGPALKLGQLVRPLLPAPLKAKLPSRSESSAGGRAARWPQRKHPRKMLMLMGCVQPAMRPNINSATARVLDACGIQTLVDDGAGCCGAVRAHLGDPEGGLADARRNIDAWWPLVDGLTSQGAVEAIVMNASACGLQVREYGAALAHDPAYAAKAARISALTRDVSELLPDLLPALRSRLGLAGPAAAAGRDQPAREALPAGLRRLAWHPPCTLQHGQRLRGGVETHLAALGFDVQMAAAEPHLCCGSAGTYSVLQPVLATQLRDRKLGHLAAQQPQVIVSANIGCIQHLQSGTTTPVRHWIEVLDEALQDAQTDRAPAATRARWAWCRASAMDRPLLPSGSAPRSLDRTICASAGGRGRHARRRWACAPARRWIPSASTEAKADPAVGRERRSRPTCTCGRCAQEAKRRGAKVIAIDPYRSRLGGEVHRSTWRCCRAPTGRWRWASPHVLIARRAGIDRDYVDAATRSASVRLAERAPRPFTPGLGRAGVRPRRPPTIVQLARDYWRHAAGGDPAELRHAARTPAAASRRAPAACLPALAGALARRAAGGVRAVLQRRGRGRRLRPRRARSGRICWRGAGRARSIMRAIGAGAGTRRRRRSKAVIVYDSNPVAVCARLARRWLAGFAARGPAHCVVHGAPSCTDTADYADLRAAGHHAARAPTTCTSPTGTCTRWPTTRRSRRWARRSPNSEVFRRLAARMGFAEPCFRRERRGQLAHRARLHASRAGDGEIRLGGS